MPEQSSAKFPRGCGGCVLYPGTPVLVQSLKLATTFNGQEGVCANWRAEAGRVDVRLLDGQVKALRPVNLQKVRSADSVFARDAAFCRVLEIFQKYDTNGDGVIEVAEFRKCLECLGLAESCLTTFLQSVDKEGDSAILYEEFCEWAMFPAEKSMKNRSDIHWPDPRTYSSDSVERVGEDDDGLMEQRELTGEDVERACGSLPDGWPDHGILIVNNMRARFVDYPVEGIVWRMRRNNFVGGRVIAAIRTTGAREVELVPPVATRIQPSSFPAEYRNRSTEKALPVYQQGGKTWNFQNMRDRKTAPAGNIAAGDKFQVLEVRRSGDYNCYFGRVDFGRSQTSKPCWVVLGLEVDASQRNFTEAERVLA